MKINLSKPIKNLDGKEMYKESAGKVLAQYLMDISTNNPEKLFLISMELLDDKDMEIPEEDYLMLVQVVEESNMPNIMKAKILIELKGE